LYILITIKYLIENSEFFSNLAISSKIQLNFKVKKLIIKQMKRTTIILMVLSAILPVFAQSSSIMNESNSGLVYALPLTELSIEVELEKTIQKPGVFYRYSERYLAVTDVITEEKTFYMLKSITIKPRPVPDASKTYFIDPQKKSPLRFISVNPNGLLCGVNVPLPSKLPENSIPPAKKKSSEETVDRNVLPLGEEYMLVGSVAKLAEGAAKQIYRIRESRLSLLTGDVDHFPADGASFTTILKELDKKEKELTELFIGSTTKEIQKQTLSLQPHEALKNEVLFRLSTLKGLVPADDLGGAPYYISVLPANINAPAENKQKSSGEYLNYIIPAPTQVSISDGKNTYFSQQFLMPQFGVVIRMPAEWLKGSDTKVFIDPATGRLLSIQE
jgi:hypothetical protein